MTINLKKAVTVLAAIMMLSIPVSAQNKKTKVITLNDNNIVMFSGEVNGANVSETIQELQTLANSWKRKLSEEPINLVLYTPGGSIQKGLELEEAVKGLGVKVNTITIFAASMGFQFAQAFDKRYIVSSGVLMSHKAYGGVEGEFGGEQPDQMSSRMSVWRQRIQELDERTVKRTNGKQTLESYQKSYTPELWVTGADAVKKGYADEIVRIKCDSSLSGFKTKSTTVDTIIGPLPIKYEIARCPLDTTPKNVRLDIETNKGRMDSDTFIRKGGEFGPRCLSEAANYSKLCANNVLLTMDRIESIKNMFIDKYTNLQNNVIKMRP